MSETKVEKVFYLESEVMIPYDQLKTNYFIEECRNSKGVFVEENFNDYASKECKEWLTEHHMTPLDFYECYKRSIQYIPRCKKCGKQIHYNMEKHKFNTYCSLECANITPEHYAKMKTRQKEWREEEAKKKNQSESIETPKPQKETPKPATKIINKDIDCGIKPNKAKYNHLLDYMDKTIANIRQACNTVTQIDGSINKNDLLEVDNIISNIRSLLLKELLK